MSHEHQLLKQLIREVLDGFGNKSLGANDSGNNLRYDVPVKGSTNVLDDEENEEQRDQQDEQTHQAACCLILSDDGKVLAVSRKDDPTAFGMPGGKVDPGETPEQAAGRELQEETGLVAKALHQVFVRKDADGFTTYTFACEVEGQIETEESGVIRWVTPQVLFAGPFGRYNQALWTKLGLPTEVTHHGVKK